MTIHNKSDIKRNKRLFGCLCNIIRHDNKINGKIKGYNDKTTCTQIKRFIYPL